MMQKKYSILLLAVVLSACEPGTVTLVEPERAAEGEAVLEVHVKLADSALAEALGWETGVPGVQAEWAYVQRWRYLFRDVQSDSAGLLWIEREGEGMYWIAAEKAVDIDGVPRVFGGGLHTRESGHNLSLKLDDPGSLVISEVHMTQPPSWETSGLGYFGSSYIELYNNSVATVYLDGIVLGVAYALSHDYSGSGHHSCSYTEPFREDPDAVWSKYHWQFPGTGTDYPLPPGAAVVVAVSAADHTAVHASMLDLAEADFEFLEVGAADNPAAPNLVFVGTETRGVPFLITNALWFVSGPVELDMLPTMLDDDGLFGDGSDYRGFPADAIRDVAVIWWDATSAVFNARDAPPCGHPIHPSFDALPGGYLLARPGPKTCSCHRSGAWSG